MQCRSSEMQRRSAPARKIVARPTSMVIASVLLGMAASASHSQDKPPPLRRYVGSPDYPALLKDPIVQPKRYGAGRHPVERAHHRVREGTEL